MSADVVIDLPLNEELQEMKDCREKDQIPDRLSSTKYSAQNTGTYKQLDGFSRLCHISIYPYDQKIIMKEEEVMNLKGNREDMGIGGGNHVVEMI